MDVFDISPKGKKRFAKWMGKRHRKLCISELVRNSKDERQLFAMCRYIDRWYDQHEGPVKKVTLIISRSSQEGLGASQEDSGEVVPEAAQTPSYVVPEKHTKLIQHNFSRHVTHRLNMFITNNPEVGISKMLSEATTEDDLMTVMDEIERNKKVIDIRVKMWTVRRL